MPNYKEMADRSTRVLNNLTGGPGPKRRSPAEQLAEYQSRFGDTSWVEGAKSSQDLAPGLPHQGSSTARICRLATCSSLCTFPEGQAISTLSATLFWPRPKSRRGSLWEM